MLTIRKEQLEILGRSREKDFEERLIRHLYSIAPNFRKPIRESDLASQVRIGIARGRRFFRTEKEIARYCEIVLLYLGGWMEHEGHPEEAIQMLHSKAIAPEVRLKNFERWAQSRRG